MLYEKLKIFTQYLKEYPTIKNHIGSGSSRSTYHHPTESEKIIKIAFDKVGILQNETEFNHYNNLDPIYKNCFAKIFKSNTYQSLNHFSLIAEYVMPLTLFINELLNETEIILKKKSKKLSNLSVQTFTEQDINQIHETLLDIAKKRNETNELMTCIIDAIHTNISIDNYLEIDQIYTAIDTYLIMYFDHLIYENILIEEEITCDNIGVVLDKNNNIIDLKIIDYGIITKEDLLTIFYKKEDDS